MQTFRKIIISLTVIAMLVAGFVYFNNPETASATWWNDQWLYRKVLTINSDKVVGDLSNFPVLVSLTDSNISGKAQEDGDDFVFTLDNGTKLKHEIESYASSTGALVAWVKIPSLSSTQDTDIYMYYGNAGVADQSDATDVWDENYKGVWHLNEATSSARYDSTGNNNTLTDYNSVGRYEGVVGWAADFEASNSEYLMRASSTLNGLNINGADQFFTISAWIYRESDTGNFESVASMWEYGTNDRQYFFGMDIDDDPTLRLSYDGTNYGETTGATNVSTGAWHYLVAGYDDSQMAIALDGSVDVDIDNPATYSSGIYDSDSPFSIGAYFNNGTSIRHFDGRIDEVRVSDISRSLAWAETEYNNQNDPATFFAEGDEETGPGPVGYWSFDEGYGSLTHDESGQGNNGTLNNGVDWVEEDRCISGKCLVFDGIGPSRAEVASFPDDLDVFTACTWAKPLSLTNAGSDTDIYLISKGWSLRYDNNGRVEFFVRTTNSYPRVYSTENIEVNKWYHICGVFTGIGNNSKIYINGNDKSNVNHSGSGSVYDQYDNLEFGAPASNIWSSNYNGYMDEVKIYPYARTADQIKQDYNAGLAGVKSNSGVSASFGSQSDKWMSDGLVGYWKFDESATTSGAIDSSGNGTTMTYYGDASTTVGKYGRAAEFDGSGDVVSVLDTSLPDNFPGTNNYNADAMTFSMWIKYDSTSGRPLRKPSIWQIQNNIWGLVTSGGSEYYTFTGISTGVWYHMVGVYDGAYMRGYVDGVLNGDPVPQTGAIGENSEEFNIGAGAYPISGEINAQIDEVRVYNRALSPDEVQKLYEWAPGPVLHLKFDEKSGSTAYDSVASSSTAGGNDGVVTTASWSRGKIGGALDFDGSNDEVTVSNSDKFGNGDMTIAFWMNPRTLVNNDRIISKYDTYGSMDWYVSYFDEIYLSVGESAAASLFGGGLVPPVGSWTHVAITRNGDEWKLYGNGVVSGQTTNSVSWTNSDDIHIASYNGSPTFDGKLDDIRIYNYARTQKQILEDMNGGQSALKSPILDINFNEGRGDTVYDASGYGNNGTLYPVSIGNTTYASMWSLDGKNNGAMEFDGYDDYVDFGDNGMLDGMSEGTVCAWLFYDYTTVTSDGVLVSKYESGNEGWLFWVDDDGGYSGRIDTVAFMADPGSVNGRVEGTAGLVTPLTWDHYCGVFKGGEYIRLYKNTELNMENNTSVVSVFDTSAYPLRLGNIYNNNRNLEGKLDDVKIWSYALSQDEIEQVYNNSKGAVWGSTGASSDTATSSSAKSREYCIPGDTSTCNPPVLELKFSEGKGTSTYDTSGNGKDGEFYSVATSPTWVRGKIDKALDFEGQDASADQINIPENSLFDFNDFTYSVWINPDDMTDWNCIMTADQSDTYLGVYNDHYAIYNRCGAITDLGADTSPGWHHISWVVSGADYYFYEDGILVASNTGVCSGSTDAYEFNIGARGDGSYGFNGIIDEVRVFNYARTPAQVAYDYNKGKPIAHWSFDECSGGTIHDESGNGNHGTLSLGSSGVTATGTCASSSNSFWYNGRNGKVNGSGSFDETDDYVGFSEISGLSGDVTISAWVYPDTLSQNGVIVSLDGTSDFDACFGIYNDNNEILLDTSGNSMGMSNMTDILTAQVWQHWLVIYKNDAVDSFYLDGELQTLNDVGDRYDVIGNQIGSRAAGTQRLFSGMIDEVKIYNYALTSEQVENEYNGGAVKFGN